MACEGGFEHDRYVATGSHIEPSGIVSLTTDFATVDGYVGALRGAILSVDPSLCIQDVTHDIPPGDVRAAAWALRVGARFFPPGTVHLVVVDPGVGSHRLALAVRRGHQMFVGPDSGLFDLVGAEVIWARRLDPDLVQGPGELSKTFHGRDLFAPAAALLASGADPAGLGPAVDPGALERLDLDDGYETGHTEVSGRVLHVDRFGNLVTSIPTQVGERALGGQVAKHVVGPPVDSYAAIEGRDAALIEGSSGMMEISVRDASAAARLGARLGDRVTLTLAPPEREP